MPQDAYTLRYLCEELNGIFKGGRVNRITEPSVDATVFTVYTESGVKKLIVDTDPAAPRIGVTEEEPKTDKTPNNFCMLLRKHLISATIDGVSLVGFDRIVKIDLTPTSQFFDAPPKTLYAELMGRYSNLILTENGKVLGANRGINFLDNNIRPLITGLKYRLPPVGDKKEPCDPALNAEFIKREDITAEKVCKTVSGIALSTAEEIVARYFDEGKGGGDFISFLRNFVYRSEKSPCIIRKDGEIKDLLVYPYKTVKEDAEKFPYLFLAEEKFFREKNQAKIYRELKTQLDSLVNTATKKAKKRLSAVNLRWKDASSAEDDRIKGELILANIYKLKTGDKTVICDNYYDGTKTEIVLDENLSPSKNAEVYYKRYNKKKRAIISLVPQRESAEQEIAYMGSVAAEIRLAENIADLVAVKEELAEYGLIRKPQVKNKKDDAPKPRIYDIFGFTVKVGRNNAENDKITFSAKGTDIWLHAKDFHSSHAIIETAGKPVPEKVIRCAAEICAYYSGGREGGKVEIAYCERKCVKKPKGAKLGFCTYDNYKSIVVKPDMHSDRVK